MRSSKNPDPRLIESYFLYELPQKMDWERAYSLLLLVLGEKPGACILGVDEKQREALKRFCEDFDYSYAEHGGEDQGIVDRMLGREKFFRPTAYISDGDRMEMLEGEEVSAETRGRFLGYPEDAVSYYTGSEEPPGMELREKLDGMEIGGEEYLELVLYVPRPDREHIEAAIEKGREREELLEEMDRKLGIDVGSRYIEELL
ncbi:MAG: hypothetical protein ABEK01_01645 [Candidatus Nanohaloarchaea archaeon]